MRSLIGPLRNPRTSPAKIVRNLYSSARLLLTSLVAIQLHATAILLIATPQFVVVATDSKVVDTHGQFVRTTCKIRQVGKAFYIPIKFVRDSTTGYDLDKTIQSIDGSSVSDEAAKAKAAVLEPLRKALVQNRKEDHAGFRENFADKKAMGVVFFGFEQNVPTVVFLGFTIEDLNSAQLRVNVQRYSCPGDCPEGQMQIFVPGELEGRFEDEHPDYSRGDVTTVADNAEAFVNFAIEEGLLDVGPPVSVMALNSPVANWLKHGACKP